VSGPLVAGAYRSLCGGFSVLIYGPPAR
jgi:hypothetical protein